MKGMKILITGSTGFLGGYISNLLLKRGYKIVGTVYPKKFGNNQSTEITYVPLDITQKKEFNKLSKFKFDAIIHTAGYINFDDDKNDFEKCFNVNVNGTLNVLNYAVKKKVKTFIYSSSVSVYSKNTNKIITEKEACFPDSYYGITKLIGELLCNKYQISKGINCCILRYGGMYGYGANHNFFVMNTLKNISQRRKITLFNKNSYRNYLYVKDAALANLFCIENKLKGIFNVVSDEHLTIERMTKIITDIFKEHKPQIQYSNDEVKNNVLYGSEKFKKVYKNFPYYSFKESIHDIKFEVKRNSNDK